MPTVLLTTKFRIPRADPNLVMRPRLIERLSAGLCGPLTLVSAPAGYGKTTLLSAWVAGVRGSMDVAWVSLDEKDNELTRFWSYVFAALDQVQAGVSEAAITQLHAAGPSRSDARRAPQSTSEPIETALTVLVNSLASLAQDCVLILDDYHAIDTPSIHASLRFFLDHLPPQVHLVVSSRMDPPLALMRLRARGQLVELREADLRLTPDQVADFLCRVMHLTLDEQDVKALETRTEGWIAGLQLAAISMRGCDDMARFIAAFTGSHRYVFDYLVHEILQRQPEGVQEFLLETCILDQMDAALCDALLSQPAEPGSQAMLEMLEHANLFTIPLDEERRWYRYHRLFADFLRNRLRQVHPERALDLHRRAAAWYEQNDRVLEAVDHALAGQDFSHAGRLIEQTAETILARSDADTLLQWFDVLPETIVHSRPRLCAYHALALLMLGELGAVEAHLQDAEKGIGPNGLSDEHDDVRGLIDGLRAMCAMYEGEIDRAAQLASEAVQHFSTRNPFLRNLGTWLMGLAHYLKGDLAACTRVLFECLELAETTGNCFAALLSVHILGYMQTLQGKLRQATTTYARGMEFLRSAPDAQRLVPTAGLVYSGLGGILCEQNDLAAAERYLKLSLSAGLKWKRAEWTMDARLNLVQLKLAQREFAEVQNLIAEIRQSLGYDLLLWNTITVETLQARVWIEQGQLEHAAEWANDKGFAYLARDDPETLHVRIGATLTLAWLLIAQREYRRAIELLAPLRGPIAANRWMGVQIEALILEAVALDGQGQRAAALTTLKQAIELAEPEGYVRVFVDRGAAMQDLIQAYRSVLDKDRSEARDDRTAAYLAYTAHLLSAFSPPPLPERPAVRDEPRPARPPSPLSDREIQVLRLIAAGLSNREVADQLVITVGTVKRHVSNVLTKLDAANRTRAVARARELGLL